MNIIMMTMSIKELIAHEICLNHQLINRIIIYNTKLFIKTLYILLYTLFISIFNYQHNL